MDSNTELNPNLPQEIRDAIRAGLLESEALEMEQTANIKEELADLYASSGGSPDLRKDARIFRDEARYKREKAARLRAGGAK